MTALLRARRALRALPVTGGWRERCLGALAADVAQWLAPGPLLVELRDRMPCIGDETLVQPTSLDAAEGFLAWAEAGVGRVTFTHQLANSRSLQTLLESLDADAADPTLAARRVWSLDLRGVRFAEPDTAGSSTRRRAAGRALAWISPMPIEPAVRANFEREAGAHPAIRAVRDVCRGRAPESPDTDELDHCCALLDRALRRREVSVASGILAEFERSAGPSSRLTCRVDELLSRRCDAAWWIRLGQDLDRGDDPDIVRFIAQIGLDTALADAIVGRGTRSLIVALLRAAPSAPSTAALDGLLASDVASADPEYTALLRVVLAGRGALVIDHHAARRPDRESC